MDEFDQGRPLLGVGLFPFCPHGLYVEPFRSYPSILMMEWTLETGDLPDYCVEKGGRLVIVNKQRTPKDDAASLLIHAPCDLVMKLLQQHLQR